MKLELKDWLTLFTFIISSGSLLISLLSFRRSKKLDNENHLFKCKIEVYQMVARSISELLKSIDNKCTLLDKYLQNPSNESKTILLKSADIIDSEVINFHFMLQGNLLVMSEIVYKPIDEFVDFLFDSKTQNFDYDVLLNAVTSCFNKAEEIVSAMKEDLNLQVLDTSLFKRLKN